MLVLSFAASGGHNCASVGGTPFVYAQTDAGSFLMPAQCSHRGGPLHLATLDQEGGRLVCPWHGRSTSVSKALATAIPAVRRGNVVTAVFPEPPGTAYALEHRPMSAELTRTP